MRDFGAGTLVGGKAHIKIAAGFAATVDTTTYHVFFTSHDPASKGLGVAARQPDMLAVQEHGGVARAAVAGRLECPLPPGSTTDYPPSATEKVSVTL